MAVIREATMEDNAQLQELNRLAPMKGMLTIRVERIPDFFSIDRRIGTYRTLVACEGGAIIGVLTVARHPAYINGECREAGVIRDIKMHPGYQGKTILFRLIRSFLDYALEHGWDILYATALRGNRRVLGLMDGRVGFPALTRAGVFFQLNLFPSPFLPKNHPFEIRNEDPDEPLLRFFDSYYQTLQLGPVMSAEKLNDSIILSAFLSSRRIASVVLADPSSYRQNVVENWKPVTGLLIGLWKFLRLFLPLPVPPAKGKNIRMLFIRYMACLPGEERALRPLIMRARRIAYDGMYSFLVAGVHQRDSVLKLFRGIPAMKVSLPGFVLSLKGDPDAVRKISQGVLFDDFTLI